MEKPESTTIPVSPGIYLYKNASGKIIYVGKARHLRRRVMSYFRPADQLTPKTNAMISHAVSLETLSTTTEKEALLLEASLIKKYRPHYNILLRDDKQYVLFRISGKEPYPRLELTRKTRKDGAHYFGPFTSGTAARETWKAIHKSFPLRRCTDRAMRNRVRPCLYYHLQQCLAPCCCEVNVEEYDALVQQVVLLLSGRSTELVSQLTADMHTAAETLEYEKAARLRDQIQAVEKTVERQTVVLAGGGDLDVLGIFESDSGLSLGILFVREGRLLEGRAFHWPGLGLAEAGELLWSFLGQYYGPFSAIPPRIVVPWIPDSTEPENPHDILEALLSEMRGSTVRIAVPRNPNENGLVDMAVANARESARTQTEKPLSERLALVLHQPQAIQRIECVDVSHTGGQSTRVGMVVFEDGKPDKASYRSYAMEDTNGDDYAALSQWAQRRLRAGPPWPDLLLIDGGRAQVSVVERVLAENTSFPIAGIAKARNEQGRPDRRAGNIGDHIFLPQRVNPLPLHEGSAELLFLQRVRDTTHDYALGRHRKARTKVALAGELQRIPGVGPHIVRQLWDRFESLEAMIAASPEELATVPGIGARRARILYDRLRELKK